MQFYLYVYIVSCALYELSLESALCLDCSLSGMLMCGQQRLSKICYMYYIDTNNIFTSTVPFLDPYSILLKSTVTQLLDGVGLFEALCSLITVSRAKSAYLRGVYQY